MDCSCSRLSSSARSRLCRELKGDLGGGRRRSVVMAIASAASPWCRSRWKASSASSWRRRFGLAMALFGGILGRAMALLARRLRRQTLSCVALLPLMFAVENVLPPVDSFRHRSDHRGAAPPEAVWRSILSTDPVEGPLALPFRLGCCLPAARRGLGEGVGAERLGEFSTGTAIERVTEWVPNRKLAFVVVGDIPAMREMSPYEHVHAPHVVGYFRTISTSFELVPRADGRTDILERTSHDLRLDPVPYWLPMARWIVRQNNARVLAHIRLTPSKASAVGAEGAALRRHRRLARLMPSATMRCSRSG